MKGFNEIQKDSLSPSILKDALAVRTKFGPGVLETRSTQTPYLAARSHVAHRQALGLAMRHELFT